MDVVAILRTLNEEQHIENFCNGYDWCDKILMADGGSTDNTIALASEFPNVEVRHFDQRIPLGSNGDFMNPEPAHVNFLVKWAESLHPTWIVFDDCDSYPSPALRRGAMEILGQAYANVERDGLISVSVKRLYMWGADHYFPKATQGWARWAWMPRFSTYKLPEDVTNFFEMKPRNPLFPLLLDAPPYALMHNFCPTEEAARRRVKWYQSWGQEMVYMPESQYAPPERLPEWAISK